MFTIIQAQPDDALRLSRFAEKTFRETFAKDNTAEDLDLYVASAFSEEKQHAELCDSKCLITLLLHEEELVGYCHLVKGFTHQHLPAPQTIELLRFYIDARWHGRGLAPLLMRELITKSQRAGFTTLWLGVWERNFRAQSFYKKWDFKKIGSHTFVLGTDPQRDLILAKDLSPTATSRGDGSP